MALYTSNSWLGSLHIFPTACSTLPYTPTRSIWCRWRRPHHTANMFHRHSSKIRCCRAGSRPRRCTGHSHAYRTRIGRWLPRGRTRRCRRRNSCYCLGRSGTGSSTAGRSPNRPSTSTTAGSIRRLLLRGTSSGLGVSSCYSMAYSEKVKSGL